MEPNKFDNHIKSLLESREIQPSEAAWSKLNNRLDKEEKSNTKKWFWLSGLAASIIGVLLMINLSSSSTNQPTIVETEAIKNKNIERIKKDVLNTKKLQNTELIVENNIEENVIIPDVEVLNKASKVTSKKENKKRNINTIIENNRLAVVENKSSKKNKINESSLAIINVNKQDIKQKELITNEADKLLAQALLAVNTPKTETIDAASLLYDVEEQVEESFRSKMFTKIKENVSTLTTVIVDRNK